MIVGEVYMFYFGGYVFLFLKSGWILWNNGKDDV